ncbi:MAG: hypothetical protein NC314_03550 [Roseburia sp.]|nr:hypothetical protein [Roseburia sp.]
MRKRIREMIIIPYTDKYKDEALDEQDEVVGTIAIMDKKNGYGILKKF